MKELTSVFEILREFTAQETFALIFYSDKHEKSAAMLKVFEKLAETIPECALWATCCLTNIPASREALKVREVPTAWFCRNGCISRIVILPQAQSYVLEARNVFVNMNVETPTLDAKTSMALLQAGIDAAVEAVTQWLSDRPLVLLSERSLGVDPLVAIVNPTVTRERAEALKRKFNLEGNALIVQGSIVEPISDGAQISTHVRELIDENKSMAQTSLDERCHRIVNSAPVMIVMKGTRGAPYCKFTKQLLAILEEAGIDKWDYFDIFSDDMVRERLKVLYNWPTYPQIYVKGKLIGGLDTVKSCVENGGNKGLRKILLAPPLDS